jgi:integrin alpha FG-GAP repeat containing protein 1
LWLVLNGACGGLCTPKGELAYHVRFHLLLTLRLVSHPLQPFGVSYPGATYKYTILDTSGARSAAQVSQLPQTAYHALLTPYSFFGLGRTNNYVEFLSVGSTRKRQLDSNSQSSSLLWEREEIHFGGRVRAPVNGSTSTPSGQNGEGLYYINLEGVIPNSKVVIIPPDTPSRNSDGEWKRELYLRPGDWIPWVSVTVVITTLLLGAVVWAFWWNERVSDFFIFKGELG